jgi:hypothetical protein
MLNFVDEQNSKRQRLAHKEENFSAQKRGALRLQSRINLII